METLLFCFYYSSASSVLPPLHSVCVYFSSYGVGHIHSLVGHHAKKYSHTYTIKFPCEGDDTKDILHTHWHGDRVLGG